LPDEGESMLHRNIAILHLTLKIAQTLLCSED